MALLVVLLSGKQLLLLITCPTPLCYRPQIIWLVKERCTITFILALELLSNKTKVKNPYSNGRLNVHMIQRPESSLQWVRLCEEFVLLYRCLTIKQVHAIKRIYSRIYKKIYTKESGGTFLISSCNHPATKHH